MTTSSSGSTKERPLCRPKAGLTAASPGCASAHSSSSAAVRPWPTSDSIIAAVRASVDRLANAYATGVHAASSCLCVPNSVAQGGAALGVQAGPPQLTAAFTQAGSAPARVVAGATPFNLVIEGRG